MMLGTHSTGYIKIKREEFLSMNDLLSIIVPCYNEEEMISIFFEEVESIELPITREYIFVNDGSTDNTIDAIKKIYEKAQDRVKYISFSRNFGKEAGIYAGLKKAQGNYVVLMDVDLQDPPHLLPNMVKMLTEVDELDCIGTRRTTRRGEPPIRSFFAKMFYKLINRISETEIVDGARDYRMMKRHMVDSVLEMAEYNRFSKGIFSWVGYNVKYLEFENREREYGETTWSFWSLLKYSIDGIVSFSTLPLTFVAILGTIIFIISILLALIFAVRTIIFDNPVQGWTSLVVIILGLGGLQLFSLGIIGEYLGKTFLESKSRPVYITKETEQDYINEDEKRVNV